MSLKGLIKRTVIVSVIVGGIISIVSGIGSCTNKYISSEGVRVGVINKYSKQGIFWKTNEGTLALEGLSSQGANLWDFSLDRQQRHGENIEKIDSQIRKYIDSQEKVKIYYVKPMETWPWRSETNYLVQKIEPVEKK